jgi:hypothetical protein
MSKKWQTEIESEIGTLSVTINYWLDLGQRGDYHTEHIPPSIDIDDVSVEIIKIDTHVLDEIKEEILESETTYDPEDFRD